MWLLSIFGKQNVLMIWLICNSLPLYAHVHICSPRQGLREGSSGGTSYLGPGLGGLGLGGRKSWGCRVKFWTKFFFFLAFHPSLTFGQKIGLNISEDLFLLLFN